MTVASGAVALAVRAAVAVVVAVAIAVALTVATADATTVAIAVAAVVAVAAAVAGAVATIVANLFAVATRTRGDSQGCEDRRNDEFHFCYLIRYSQLACPIMMQNNLENRG